MNFAAKNAEAIVVFAVICLGAASAQRIADAITAWFN